MAKPIIGTGFDQIPLNANLSDLAYIRLEDVRSTPEEVYEGLREDSIVTPDSAAGAFDRVKDDYDVTGSADVFVRPTIDLNFAENRYTIYKGIADGFTEVPFSQAIDFSRGGSTKTGITPTRRFEETDVDKQVLEFDLEDGRSLGLLFDEQHTNLLLHNEDFTQSEWLKLGTTVTPNDTLAPDGSLTADKIVETTETGGHSVSQNVTSQVGAPLALLVFAKAGERRFIRVGTAGTTNSAAFDLVAGTIVVQPPEGANMTAAIFQLVDGWNLIYVEKQEANDTTQDFNVNLLNNSGATGYTGDGTSGAFLWRPQLEYNVIRAHPSIKTEGSQVTRSPDDGQLLIADKVNTDSFLTYVEFIAPLDDTGDVIIYLSNSTTAGARRLQVSSSNGIMAAETRNSSNQTVAKAEATFVAGAKYKAAILTGPTESIAAINGVSSTALGDSSDYTDPLVFGQRFTTSVARHTEGTSFQVLSTKNGNFTAKQLEDMTRISPEETQ